MKRTSSLLRSFRHRNFRLFFGGQLISLIGTWMQTVAQSWLIYQLTHSAMLLGFAGFLGQIPSFITAPFGGVVADRHNRHRVLLITQISAMILALILAWLTLTGLVKVWHIFLLSAFLGMVNGFDIPARQAFVVEIVGKEDMSNAIALNSSMFNGARIVGPAIAGILVSLVGEGWCFFLNGVSYIAVILGLWLMHLPPRVTVRHPHSALEHIKEGFHFVANNAPIRGLLTLLGVVSLMGVPYTVLMPVFADEILKGGPQGLGILMGMTGVGTFLGALTLAMKREIQGLGLWVTLSDIVFGLSLIAFSQSQHFWLSAFLLIPVGYSMMVGMASSNTLIQAMVPDRLRGRVMAFYAMMFIGMAPFGSLIAGILAKPLGAPSTVAIGGIVCTLAGFIFWRNLPKLREEGRRMVLQSRSDPFS